MLKMLFKQAPVYKKPVVPSLICVDNIVTKLNKVSQHLI